MQPLEKKMEQQQEQLEQNEEMEQAQEQEQLDIRCRFLRTIMSL